MRKSSPSILFTLLAFVSLRAGEVSNPLPPAGATAVVAGRFDRVAALLDEEVERKRIAGAVALVLHRGRPVYSAAMGYADLEARRPMAEETIFRIASMTKPITSVAVMMLVEEGKLRLDDRLAKYLPEFKNPRVLDSKGDGAVPASREITIHDLLTHTSGLSYRFLAGEKLGPLYRAAGICDGLAPADCTLGETARRLAGLPLKWQPGGAWEYGLSIDVLGRLIEVVSGNSLDGFFRERIFEPLGMADTHFTLPIEKRQRLAALYRPGADRAVERVEKDPMEVGPLAYSASLPFRESGYFSGGAGLVSTASDYARFLQMLLNGGQLDAKRLLKRETVDLMTRNQIGELKVTIPGHGDKFGYGFGIVTAAGRGNEIASPGTFSWGGIYNTFFWVDPEKEVVGILLTQLFPFDQLSIREDFKRLVYQALAGPPPTPLGEARCKVSEVTFHGDMECYQVETPAATYLFGKRGAGFASILDPEGHDWISYRPGGLVKGEYRGLPKCGQPVKFFHCGYGYGMYRTENAFSSRVSLRAADHLRIESETRDGASACAWDFYPTHATLTLWRIGLPTYWFLYEGAPGGKLDADRDFVIRPDGTKTTLDQPWSQVVPWVCFGAAESKFGFLCVNHQEPEAGESDSYVSWPFQKEKDGSFQDMTVFGFGRKGYRELVEHIPDLKRLPARFSIGFVDAADHPTAKAAYESIHRLAFSSAPLPAPKPITLPLRALAANPRYFTDGSGRAVYLTGSHTWNNFQDWGTDDSIQPLDFDAYVKMLVAHHHNLTLLWATELPAFHGLPTTEKSPPDFSVSPHPWQRTGPGNASDGKPKFDLTKFQEEYFDRLQDRVRRLNEAGVYAGVYLFTGEFLLRFRFPGDGYPFTGSNNVNGIDDGGGVGAVTMKEPNSITTIQDAYVKKVIDTLNPLPNVLWIVSEEAPAGSEWWNAHLIDLVRSHEKGKPLQHPIGYGALDNGRDDTLTSSDADWIAPGARISPTSSCGTGHPACKVNVNDSDHSYFGMWNDSPQANRNYFWINFTNGNQTLFMDPYLVDYPREGRNRCPSPVHGIGAGPDRRWDPVRGTMGSIRAYADRMDLASMAPEGKLASTGHALATSGPTRAEILVYQPAEGQFTVDLSGINGKFAVEWMEPATGAKTQGEAASGGAPRTFRPPFSGDAVLYLKLMVPAVKGR